MRESTERKTAEKELFQTKLDWELTFDSLPDLIAILDEKHRIVRANRTMAQRLGMTAEQCVGLNCFECVHKTNQPVAFCPHV